MADELFDRINQFAGNPAAPKAAPPVQAIGVKAPPVVQIGDPHRADAIDAHQAAMSRFNDIEQEKKSFVNGSPRITVGPDGRFVQPDAPKPVAAAPAHPESASVSPFASLPDAEFMSRFNAALGSESMPPPQIGHPVDSRKPGGVGLKSVPPLSPGVQPGSPFIYGRGQETGSAGGLVPPVQPGLGVGQRPSLEQMYQHAIDMANRGGDYKSSPIYDDSQAYGSYQGPMVGVNRSGNTALEWSQHAAQIAAAMQGHQLGMAKLSTAQPDKVGQFAQMANMPESARDMYFAANGWSPEEIRSYNSGATPQQPAVPSSEPSENSLSKRPQDYIRTPASNLAQIAPVSRTTLDGGGEQSRLDKFARDMQELGYLNLNNWPQSPGQIGVPLTADQVRAKYGVRSPDF